MSAPAKSASAPQQSAPSLPAPPAYPTTCPTCGDQLAPLAADPDTAPWLCPTFHEGVRGFWTAQLNPKARKLWRAAQHDHGFGPEAQAILTAIATERGKAAQRGTSLREDQLQLTHPDALKGIKTNDAKFAALVTHALALRGG